MPLRRKIRNFSRSPTRLSKELKDSIQQEKTVGSKGGVLKLCFATEGQYQLHLQLVRDMKRNKRGLQEWQQQDIFRGDGGDSLVMASREKTAVLNIFFFFPQSLQAKSLPRLMCLTYHLERDFSDMNIYHLSTRPGAKIARMYLHTELQG